MTFPVNPIAEVLDIFPSHVNRESAKRRNSENLNKLNMLINVEYNCITEGSKKRSALSSIAFT